MMCSTNLLTYELSHRICCFVLEMSQAT